MWLGKQRGRAEVSDTYSVNLHGEVIHVWRIRVNRQFNRFSTGNCGLAKNLDSWVKNDQFDISFMLYKSVWIFDHFTG